MKIPTQIKENKITKWMNLSTKKEYEAKFFPNRLFLTKLLGILAIMCFVIVIIITAIAPRESVPTDVSEYYQTIAPYPFIISVLFLLAIIFGIPAMIFLVIHEYTREKE